MVLACARVSRVDFGKVCCCCSPCEGQQMAQQVTADSTLSCPFLALCSLVFCTWDYAMYFAGGCSGLLQSVPSLKWKVLLAGTGCHDAVP